MRCRQCQKEIENLNGSNFCPNCGGTLMDEKFVDFFRKVFSSKRNVVIFILAEVLFLGLFAGLFFTYRYQVSQKNEKINQLVEKAEEIKVEWSVKERVLPMVYFGENKKLVELKVSSQTYGKLRTELEVPGIIKKEIREFDIAPGSRIYYLDPDISEEGYRGLENSHNVDLILKVVSLEDNKEEKVLVEANKSVLFLARGDMIWKDDGVDNSKYIVRLINKDRPEIAELIRKAADHMKELGSEQDAMVGVLGDEKEQQRQMEAIFTAIRKDYAVRYVLAPVSYDDASIQHIKYPEEVLNTKSGLCIELAALVAAALESLDIRSVLVLTNTHAWVGMETGSRSDKFVFIETTALDRTSTEAVEIAQKNWELIKNNPGYKLIKVNELRAEGINPIKY